MRKCTAGSNPVLSASKYSSKAGIFAFLNKGFEPAVRGSIPERSEEEESSYSLFPNEVNEIWRSQESCPLRHVK